MADQDPQKQHHQAAQHFCLYSPVGGYKIPDFHPNQVTDQAKKISARQLCQGDDYKAGQEGRGEGDGAVQFAPEAPQQANREKGPGGDQNIQADCRDYSAVWTVPETVTTSARQL